MTKDNQEKIQEIREVLQAATPGPWEWRIKNRVKNNDDGFDLGDLNYWKNEGMPRRGISILDVTKNKYGQPVISAWNEADAEIIANAREWLQWQNEQIETLQQQLDAAKREIQLFNNFKELIQGDFDAWVESSWTFLQTMYREIEDLKQQLDAAKQENERIKSVKEICERYNERLTKSTRIYEQRLKQMESENEILKKTIRILRGEFS